MDWPAVDFAAAVASRICCRYPSVSVRSGSCSWDWKWTIRRGITWSFSEESGIGWLEGDGGEARGSLMAQPKVKHLLSSDYFSVGRTLIEACAPTYEQQQGKNKLLDGCLAAGLIGGAPWRLAAQMARVVDDGGNLHVLSIVTRGPTENPSSLLYLRGLDLPIVNSESLEECRAQWRRRSTTGSSARPLRRVPLDRSLPPQRSHGSITSPQTSDQGLVATSWSPTPHAVSLQFEITYNSRERLKV